MSVYMEIVGQSKAIETLLRAQESMTHSWLFVGPPGSGRSNLARAFAASLICSNGGCGQCTDCQTIKIGSHPDVEVFSTEGVAIKVDEVRELVSRSSWGASMSRWRITIVEDCDRMTESAANALLKIIEEPGEQSLWFLCAPTAEEVLPTIRSRCRLVQLVTPTNEEVSQYLQRSLGLEKKTSELAAKIAQGHVGRAKNYAFDIDTLQLRRKIASVFISIRDEGSAITCASHIQDIAINRAETRNTELFESEEQRIRNTVQGPNRGLLAGGTKVLKDLEKSQKARTTRAIRDELDSYFLWLQALVRDALSPSTIEAESYINPDLAAEIQTLKQLFSPNQLDLLNERIAKYRSTLDSNAAQLLSLESFTLDFLGLQTGP